MVNTDSEGRFCGKRRVDCESVPRLPAVSVRFAIEDPRRIPFLFVWRNDWERTVETALVTADESAGGRVVELTRQHDGGPWRLHALRPLVPGGGRDFLLACPTCDRPRRHLYAWARCGNRAERAGWPCRLCAGLRYISEGCGRNPLGPYPRFPLDPWVFSSRQQVFEALGV